MDSFNYATYLHHLPSVFQMHAFSDARDFSIQNVYCIDNSRLVEDEVLQRTGIVEAACLIADHRCSENADICHPGTRAGVLEEIMSWVRSSDLGQRVMWVNGPAGSGKSTIARTVAGKCDSDDQLASSFFFSRAEPGSGKDDGSKLIPTIACQLAISLLGFREQLRAEIGRNPTIWNYSMSLRLQKMVLEPLNAIVSSNSPDKANIPRLFVIDALDECKDECKDAETQVQIIDAIASALFHYPSLNLRFLILSRPEMKIRKAFNTEKSKSITRTLVLDERYNPGNDIEIYLRSEFLKIKSTHSIGPHCLAKDTEWPSDNDIKLLVERASGQFIYASTIIKYVMDDRKDPKKRLQIIISGPAASTVVEREVEVVQYVQPDSRPTSSGIWNFIVSWIRR